MIKVLDRYASKDQLKEYIKDCISDDIKTVSGEQVINLLFDHNDGWYGHLRVVDEDYRIPERLSHRLNKLWAYPLTVMCSPFRYLAYGRIGWSGSTKFGKFILGACGEK